MGYPHLVQPHGDDHQLHQVAVEGEDHEVNAEDEELLQEVLRQQTCW